MNFYYVHPTAWIKRYVTAPGGDLVREMFDNRETLVCAQFGVIELRELLLRATGLDRAVCDVKLREVESDWASFVWVHLSDEIVRAASDLVARRLLDAARAVHVASAVALKRRFVEENDRVTLVATDLELLAVAQAVGLEALNPEEISR